MPELVRSALRVLPVRAAESFLRLFRLWFAPPGRLLRLVPSDAVFRPVPSVPPFLPAPPDLPLRPARSGLVSRSASSDSPFLLAPRDSPLRPVSFVRLPQPAERCPERKLPLPADPPSASQLRVRKIRIPAVCRPMPSVRFPAEQCLAPFVLLPAELRTVPFVLPPVELRPVLRPVEPRFVLLPAELRPAPLLPHPAGAYRASFVLPRKPSAPEL